MLVRYLEKQNIYRRNEYLIKRIAIFKWIKQRLTFLFALPNTRGKFVHILQHSFLISSSYLFGSLYLMFYNNDILFVIYAKKINQQTFNCLAVRYVATLHSILILNAGLSFFGLEISYYFLIKENYKFHIISWIL